MSSPEATGQSRKVVLRFLVPLDESMDCHLEDLEGLAGVEHFGFPAGWLYGMGLDGWPQFEPRPSFGALGMIPIGDA